MSKISNHESFHCLKNGIVCFTGMLGNTWVLHDFEPMVAIPFPIKLTQFVTESMIAILSAEGLQQIVDRVAAGAIGLASIRSSLSSKFK